MAIPSGTKFQGIPPSNDDLNKRSNLINLTAPVYDISEFSSASQDVQSLTVQGTDDTTTAVAIYGVNLVTTSDTSNFASRLPVAQTGKSVTFVNTSGLPITIYPSATGGEINEVVDAAASIPSDGESYTFTCVENPLPGAWVWQPPATTQLFFPNSLYTGVATDFIAISHTTGATTDVSGWETSNLKTGGVGTVCSGGNIWFNPTGNSPTYMRSESVKTRLSKIKVYTSIKDADFPGGTNIGVQVFMYQSQLLPDCSTCSSIQIPLGYIQQSTNPAQQAGTTIAITNAGTGTGTTLPGENDTLYNVLDYGTSLPALNSALQIGQTPSSAISCSQYFWCLGFQILSTMPTDTYYFKVVIEAEEY